LAPDASDNHPSLSLPAPPAAPPSTAPGNLAIAILVIFAALFAIYAPSLQYHFILDDHRFTADPRIQNDGHLWEYFANYTWAQFTGGPLSFYRPIFVLWMRFNFIFNELSPQGWHAFSIAKHAAAALLLYLLIARLLGDHAAALLAAMLFALHPAQTESVAWVTVPDPLMGIGLLGALLLYLRYAAELAPIPAIKKTTNKKNPKAPPQKIAARTPLPWLIASAVVCALAMLAKETAIVLPVLLFFLTLFMLRPEIPAGKSEDHNIPAPILPRLLSALRITLPFAVAALLYLLIRFSAFGGKLGSLTQHLSWRSTLLTWPAILWFYIKVLFWPVRSYAYGDPTLAENFSFIGVVLPFLGVAIVVAALALLFVWLWRKAQRDVPPQSAVGVQYALCIGVLLLVLPLLPALNLNVLNPGDFLHGRYVYTSSIGLMILGATAVHLTSGKLRTRLLWAGGLLAILFAGLTLSQEKLWHDDLTLFSAAHQLAPNNPWVALNLERANVQAALLLVEQGRCADALPVFRRVTQKYPQEWSAWSGLGYCYFTLNDLPKAEDSLHRAAQLSRDPRTIEMWQELRAHMNLAPIPLD
jgi:tetratricopeptide (TPR) repeat protein